MIRSFKHQLAADLFFERVTGASRRFPPELRGVARRKLQYLNSAAALIDLRSPPGNHLEALKGNRKGQYSIRINDQWRVAFRWEDGPKDVEVGDYH
jgi:toxin HigB-1